jgi:hypothetical protein
MKNLPRDIQEMVVGHLDPKSMARLRTISKDMKRVVDATQPPTGSYKRRTGRFQKRFSLRGMEKCASKHKDHFMEMGYIHHYAHFQEFGIMNYKKMRKSYDRNTLFRDFKIITAEHTEDEHMETMLNMFQDMVLDQESRHWVHDAWIYDTKEKRKFRRRVIRLLKLWSKTNDTYIETLKLARRRTHQYTDAEERTHKDRLMDAIIVQTSVLHSADDPTRTILGKDGTPLSLEKKIENVVKKCMTSLKS